MIAQTPGDHEAAADIVEAGGGVPADPLLQILDRLFAARQVQQDIDIVLEAGARLQILKTVERHAEIGKALLQCLHLFDGHIVAVIDISPGALVADLRQNLQLIVGRLAGPVDGQLDRGLDLGGKCVGGAQGAQIGGGRGAATASMPPRGVTDWRRSEKIRYVSSTLFLSIKAQSFVVGRNPAGGGVESREGKSPPDLHPAAAPGPLRVVGLRLRQSADQASFHEAHRIGGVGIGRADHLGRVIQMQIAVIADIHSVFMILYMS